MAEQTPAAGFWKGTVVGTPRTYGDRRTEDIWRREIMEGQWDRANELLTSTESVHLDFELRVNPDSGRYNGNVSVNGPDLDTMVIGALGGILDCRNAMRPTLRLIKNGALCKCVTASKRIVDNDANTGFTLRLQQGTVIPFEYLTSDAALAFFVSRQELKSHRRRAVQQAAEQANKRIQFRAPRHTRIAVTLAFARDFTRNPLSANWLEGVIDGLGASRVGNDRFFDGPSHYEFGYDDSVVYRLTCAHVQGLPGDMGLYISCGEIGGED